MHPTVGIMLQSLVASAAWLVLQHLWPPARQISAGFRIDLNEAVFHWMLGALLFAGGMHVDLSELKNQRISVGVLSIIGTIISTFLIAGLSFALCRLAKIDVSFAACAVFGAVISPTDPVAVMGFLKTIDAPRDLEAIIGGESLFNDGVGVVLFTVLSRLASGHDISWLDVPGAFLTQTIGGAGIGLVAGLIVQSMLYKVDNYRVEVLLTLALAMGGYTLADSLHVSGPIAAVVAGLIIGNHSQEMARLDVNQQYLHDFWELVDETLNAILFLLVGLVVLDVHLQRWQLVMTAVAVPLVLFARWFSVWISTTLVSLYHRQPQKLGKHAVGILTWGGLRGGLALAMALSLPAGIDSDRLVIVVFGVVICSVLVQGSTLSRIFRFWLAKNVVT